MAITTQQRAAPPSARTYLEDIKTAVSSTACCCSATVAALQDLLSSRPQKDSAAKDAARTKTTSSRTTTTARSRTTPAPRASKSTRSKPTATTIPILDEAPVLTPKEKFCLATEVVNTALKTLSDAVKAQSKQPPQTPSTTKAGSPLSPRNANPRSPPHALGKNARPATAAAHPEGPAAGVTAVAECARLGFGYLRTAEAYATAGKDLPALQLENGMLALISKLIGLGLVELGIREARALKRRLETAIAADSQLTSTTKTSSKDSADDKETLASLLHFEKIPERNVALLNLLASHQLNVLRLVALAKKPTTTNAIPSLLTPSSPSAPQTILLTTAAALSPTDTTAKAKLARHLESLSQALLALCPSVSSAEDQLAVNAKLRPTPSTALRLHAAAFGARLAWWRFAGHRADVDAELWAPVGKCVAAYARRASRLADEGDAYRLAKDVFERLDEQVMGLKGGKEKTTANAAHRDAVRATLSGLAQAAGLLDEALAWIEGTEELSAGMSEARAAAAVVRKAGVWVESFAAGKKAAKGEREKRELQETVRKARDALTGGLRGDAAELDHLLAEVTALRKGVSRWFVDEPEAGPALVKRDPALLGTGVGVAALCVAFLSRYVGVHAPPPAEPKAIRWQEERRAVARKIVRGFVDTAVLAARVVAAASQAVAEEWDACARMLLQLRALVEHVEAEEIDLSWHESVGWPMVKLSNVFWTRYTQCRREEEKEKEEGGMMRWAVPMMEAAKVLEGRSQEEKEMGLLAQKLARTAEAWEGAGNLAHAERTFREAVQAYVEVGALEEAALLAQSFALEDVWATEEKSVASLGRTLRSLMALVARHGRADADAPAYFDDEELDPVHRATVLEWQLWLWCKAACKPKYQDETMAGAICGMAGLLFQLYDAKRFPVRRHRVAVMVLRLALEASGVLTEELLQEAVASRLSSAMDLGDDVSLEPYRLHTASTHSACLALLDIHSPSSTDHLKTALLGWQTMFESRNATAKMDNFAAWQAQMQSIIDFLAVKGHYELSLPALRVMLLGTEKQTAPNASDLVSALTQLSLQFLRLGYNGKASAYLAQADAISNNAHAPIAIEAALRHCLAHAELHLATHQLSDARRVLDAAEARALTDQELKELAQPTTSLLGRIRLTRLIADAEDLHARLALAGGQIKEAHRHAKRAVWLNRKVWASLESRYGAPSPRSPSSNCTNNNNASEVEGLAISLARLTTSSRMRDSKEAAAPCSVSMTHAALAGPAFWSLVPALMRSLEGLSGVFEHVGMFQEALYFAEQAGKVAGAVGGEAWQVRDVACRVQLFARGGKVDAAAEALERGKGLLERLQGGWERVRWEEAVAAVRRCLGDEEEELRAYERAEEVLGGLVEAGFVEGLERLKVQDEDVVERLGRMKIQDDAVEKPKTVAKAKATRGRKTDAATKAAAKKKAAPRSKAASKTAAAPKAASKAVVKKSTMASEESHTLLDSLRGDVLRRKAMALLVQEKLAVAAEVLQQAEAFKVGNLDTIMHQSVNFKWLLLQAMKKISSDFTFNVLPESTISFPALKAERKASEAYALKPVALASSRRGAAGARSRSPAAARRTAKAAAAAAKEDFVALLTKARECVLEIQPLAEQTGSGSVLQQVCSVLSHVTILLSAASPGGPKGDVHPLYAAYLTELPKRAVFHHERDIIAIEEEAQQKGSELTWPSFQDQPSAEEIATTEFQQEYIDIIPATWTAISLSVNEAHNELYITRYRAHQTPFILRLPLARHNSRDVDEDVFSFDEGKAELTEIIELSNFSTHDKRDFTVKGSKSEWWEEREALDARLRDLCVNVESIWLGGFRGIFSQEPIEPRAFAQFQKTFENLLNRHLPSRRGRGQTKKVSFDPRILELFVGLGDPDAPDADLDEPLMDLLYFIVDILQFNGERNAYDEIDFDTVCIETLDALRDYYSNADAVESENQHLILILDKELHCFPWESLPSFQSLSISRLPSLTALRERILSGRASQRAAAANNEPDVAQDGHRIQLSTCIGTTILNPSRDLDATQKRLHPHLSAVRGGQWTHITARAPSENEFSSALANQDLLIYIGHGSGAQYIRARSVRRLCLNNNDSADAANSTSRKRTCATAFLMGCSSALLVERGTAFEPTGMLAAYLTAGAPAVLGALWDVTDRDCDRFSVRVGAEWGLWAEDERVFGKGGRERRGAGGGGKGKGGRGRGKIAGMRVGLDEAVRRAREVCYLRYLNGAAFVVYGVPVFVE